MIEVFEPIIGEDEIEAVVAALRRGEISGSFGESIPAFEQEFANYVGCEYGVAVSSGSTALHVAVAAAEIGAGDEVLVSSSTNIATALAVIHNGAVPVPVDSELLLTSTFILSFSAPRKGPCLTLMHCMSSSTRTECVP